MAAKGKVNASKVQINDRIIVRDWVRIEKTYTEISATKTGEGVHVARVIEKVKATNARGYVVRTTSGEFYADPIETMWLAPEDPAGIKRAHVEALAEDIARQSAKVAAREVERQRVQDEHEAEALVEYEARAAIDQTAAWLTRHDCDRATFENVQALIVKDHEEALTLDSHAGKVDNMNNESTEETCQDCKSTEAEGQHEGWAGHPFRTAEVTETQTAPAKNHTGSTVVSLLEKVWTRIREDHPELPEVVIVTGSGEGSKWGHFRAESWKVRAEEGAAVSETKLGRRHELFLASEALAKGASQVLQTMLHEGAHTLSRVRDVKDTSRQGRWHNATFRKAAEEMGLEHRASSADKSHGFAFVSLTTATKARYADLLAELDSEIRLTGLLPAWLGGTGDEDENGGEKMTGKPKSGEAKTSGNLKATCQCTEPLIIRLSQKVLALGVVKCESCDSLFTAA